MLKNYSHSMDRNEIRSTFEQLARSQGFYGRLLADIDQLEPEDQDTFWVTLERQNFHDAVDLVMYIEE